MYDAARLQTRPSLNPPQIDGVEVGPAIGIPPELMTDLLRSYPDPLKAEQHDQRGRPGSDIEFVGLPSPITASQLRDSLPLFPVFPREQLLITHA